MDRRALDRFISSYTNEQISKDLFFELYEKGIIDNRQVRNELIIRDYAMHYKKGTPIMDIYASIAITYNVSEETVRAVLRQR